MMDSMAESHYSLVANIQSPEQELLECGNNSEFRLELVFRGLVIPSYDS